MTLQLDIVDANGTQYRPAHRNLKLVKSFFGGEDVSLGFVLDRSAKIDWPEVGYGYEVNLRHGLTAVWSGTIRQIEQDVDSIMVNCAGNWVWLDDFRYDAETTQAGNLATLAAAVITKAIAMGAGISADTSLIAAVTKALTTLVFDKLASCWDVMKEAASYGDQNNKTVGWGIESGGNRVYVTQPNYDVVRYVVDPRDAVRLRSRGDTMRDFATEGWGRYGPEGEYTEKYYAHVTTAGIIANTVSAGDDRASVVYGVQRDAVKDCGSMNLAEAIEALQAWLIEHAHPQVKSSYDIYYPVQDLGRGGARIQPYEMEMGHVVQIPYFRATEAEGAAGVDLREWDTTFLLIGMSYDDNRKVSKLYPEEAREDFERMISYSRLLSQETGSAQAA